jgi:ABC-type phosphate/phosphonate transport system permease subunit
MKYFIAVLASLIVNIPMIYFFHINGIACGILGSLAGFFAIATYDTFKGDKP